MEKSYDPTQVEPRWYRVWSERGYFTASVMAEGRPYAIVIPPPNITGSLHMGHALNNTLQDILIRWRRMQGMNVLWVPGTDHAGIATQNVVEKQLLGEGTSREQLGRERFIQRIWEWKAQSGGTIIDQLKRLGASCDWTRLRFTLDEGLSKAVREVFVRLYEDGLLYRGERLINWCPRCLTALSDIEVEHEDVRGKLYHIEYPLADDPATRLVGAGGALPSGAPSRLVGAGGALPSGAPSRLIVATTRPETMLGDTAVAVHPEDPRYNRLIGGTVRLPLTLREIPIVGDPILVNREFGTGAVKITPAHDFNDFEAGIRHNLARLSIFDQHARMDASGMQGAQVNEALRGRLARKPAHEARAIVVEALEKGGHLVKIEDHAMALGKCYRCKTVVEPYLSPQWFVKIKSLAEPAIRAVEEGRIRLIPESWVNNYLGWMQDIKDWCVSRQIWWGHQIPAWYCRHCNEGAITQTSPKSYALSSEAKPLVARQAPSHCPDCGQLDFVRDPDVLDTWFSSALWPFSTLGWPDQTPELARYYPTAALVTGFDILFFWVARMIMMGLKVMREVPFREVYIHALVRDAEGQKMSKSRGNVIDPLTMMDKYGTDALRFTLAAMASPGRDIKLSEERIEGYRNFANKLWNAARFILMNLEGERAAAPVGDRPEPDRWITSRLHRCIGEVNASLEAYRFDEGANSLYHFIWHAYCDQFLERAKAGLANKQSREAALTRQTLVETFEMLLRLLHPFMPFITEEIWQVLPHTGESVMVAPFPVSNTTLIDGKIEQEHENEQAVIAAANNSFSVQRIIPSQGWVYIQPSNSAVEQFLKRAESKIKFLTRTSKLEVGEIGKGTPHDISVASSNTVVIGPGHADVFVLPLVGAGNLNNELARKEKRIGELGRQMEQDQKKLSNPDFVSKVPNDVLEKTKKRYEECRLEHEKLSSEVQRLRALVAGDSK